MALDLFTPNARDQIFDPTSGQLTEIGRRLIRLLSQAASNLPPITAQYWLSTSDPTLTAEQNLGALAPGYLKLAVAIGIATPSTVAAIPQADVTGLVAALAAKATLPIAESDVTNLGADLAAKAPLASPALSGTPTAPTAAGATNTTQLATTAFVLANPGSDATKAPLASPALTGTPTAPTAAAATNTTQIATTAMVQAAIAAAPAVAGSVRAIAYATAVAAVASGVFTVLALNAEDVDTHNGHDLVTNNSRYTIPVGQAGFYHVRGGSRFAAYAGGTQVGLALYKNGVSAGAETHANVGPAAQDLSVTKWFVLAAGDYLELAAYQDSGGAVNVGSASRQIAAELTVVRVA